MVIEGMEKIVSETINGRFIEIYKEQYTERNTTNPSYDYPMVRVEIYVNHEIFLTHKTNHFPQERLQKFLKNFSLCPEQATMVMKKDLGEYRGKLLAGALEDSCYTVYSFVDGFGGLRGFACNVFWIPTKEELKEILVITN